MVTVCIFVRGCVYQLGLAGRHTHFIADEAEANALFCEARAYDGAKPEILWDLVNKKFERVMSSSTRNYQALLRWGISLHAQALLMPNVMESRPTIVRAISMFRKSVRTHSSFIRSVVSECSIRTCSLISSLFLLPVHTLSARHLT